MPIVLDGTSGITTPDLTDSSLTANRVVYAGTGGNLTGASTFVFDGSNLGVGTSSPATKLAVAGGIAGTGGANISGGGWGVLPYVSSSLVVDTTSNQSRFFATGDASNFGTYIWYGGKTGGSTSTYMTLNASGYLNIPNQPAFSQIGASSFTVNTTGDLIFTSSNVWSSNASTLLNTGNNFNVANGRFTAPVAGNYLFILSCACAFSSGYFYMYFFKNGLALANANRNFSQNSQAVSQTLQMVIPLAAGDYITCATNNNATGFALYAPNFCGYLVS